MEQIRARLFFIYNYRNIEIYLEGICKAIERLIQMPLKHRKPVWDETDLVLVTYGDQFLEKNHSGLYTLRKVYGRHFVELFEIVHLLPFYPSSSDDGFAVIDYKAVDPAIGDWEEVRQFSQSARLMFDLVCNHVSAKSEWFLEYVKGNSVYQNYFIEADPAEDLSEVVRPRTSPLLTKFILANGEEKHLWTTFSEDQVDLNFAHPAVLAEIVDVLLFYLEQGAEYLRLDAIGFIWKEIGTPCLHHEKTHQIIKLFREVIDRAAPGTLLLTETNVPHQDNISYFGNGHDEAHLVYQFPLPALVLYSIHFENTRFLKEWANSLPKTAPETTFYNFLASHDGIGLNPVRGILPEEDIKEMAEQMKREGALISYKTNESGEAIP
ncbi:Alpha amylase, catalytic domain [Planococcus glaciei]|nr:Alpha amylase, catalytic domain [Planococcus glaciei]